MNKNKENKRKYEKKEYVQMTREQAAALYTSATVSNLINEFLTYKYGQEYVKFMEETAAKWIEASRKEQEARASEAHAERPVDNPNGAE